MSALLLGAPWRSLVRSLALVPTRSLLFPRTCAPLMCVAGDSKVRLDKLLADRGAGSRKDVDRMIRRGLVEVEGEIVGKAGAKLKVPFSTCPVVDGFDYPPPPLLAAYHKPLGVVSSMRDDQNRPDLSSVLPLPWQKSLHPVGRLDADTTGLLLFSRDGDLTHRLLHPKYVVEREYVADVENAVDADALGAQLAEGIETIEDGEPLIVQGKLLGVSGQTVRLVVTEGKYRMVRRVLANAGHPVVRLHRTRYGAVVLDELEIEEGEAVEIEGGPLEWALGLRAEPAPPTGQERDASRRAARQAKSDRASAGLQRETAADAPATEAWPPRDPVAAMEEAWMPRVKDIGLVEEEAGCSKEEAIAALKKHRGDIVKALQEVM